MLTYLRALPVTEQIAHSVSVANFDGVLLRPVQAVECPRCGGVAVIVRTYLGGYGEHYALRCTRNREHGLPVVDSEGRWVAGRYERDFWSTQIVAEGEL